MSCLTHFPQIFLLLPLTPTTFHISTSWHTVVYTHAQDAQTISICPASSHQPTESFSCSPLSMDFFDVTIWTFLNNLYHVILLFSIAEFYLCLLNALMEIKYYLLNYLLTYCYNCYNFLYKSEPHIHLTIIRLSPNMDSSWNSQSFSSMSWSFLK